MSKLLKYSVLLSLLFFVSKPIFACHNGSIDNVTTVNNSNGTTTYTIDLTVEVGTLDGRSLGFALIFGGSLGAPLVLTNPAFTPTLSRAGFNDLTAFTAGNIGSGMGGSILNYFDDRYANRTDVLTYETDDDFWGFGSTSYSKTVEVTVQGCVETIVLDNDFRTASGALVMGDAQCTVLHTTGISCSSAACGTCSVPTCGIAGSYSDYNTAATGSNHCSQMNLMGASPVNGGTFTSYHQITSSLAGSVGVVVSVGVNAVIGGTSCPVTRTAVLYPLGSSCSAASAISPTTTTANGSPFYNPEWSGLSPNTDYVIEIEFTVPTGCDLIDHCESYYFPSNSFSCTADVGNVSVSGGVAIGTNEYNLSNCQTINFTASNEDLNGGLLTYGWAVFSCNPTLPFSSAQITDFTNHPCYLGSDYGLISSDQDAGGVSATIPGGFSSLWILPYTSDVANSLDADGDGCYDFGDVIQVNYLAPVCGDCSSPSCAADGVNEFVDRTYLLCDDPCADLNDLTYITYHTILTDNFGNVGVVQQLSFNQFGCTGLSRSGVLRDVANSCLGPDILPNISNANGVGSGFNPEWMGLTPNTNYTLILTTVIGSNCYYDFGCVDFYGIPTCNTIVGTPYNSTICPSGSVVFNGTTYDINNLTGSETFTAANGCDSIVSVTITVQQAIVGTPYTSTICPSGSIFFNGTTYDINNLTGSETFTAANGCDSIVSVTITIQQAVYGAYSGYICENDSITYNGTIYNSNNLSGSDTLLSSGGCDSIVSINFSLVFNSLEDVTANICSGESFEYNGVIYDSSNLTGYFVYQTINGCDSIVTVNVNQYSDYLSVLDTTVYGSNTLDFNGLTYNSDNTTSTEVFSSVNGCDSTVTVNVVFENESIFFIPNGFSPNGDGYNDYLYVMGGGMQEIVFRVFNRWGQLIYETDCCCEQQCGWDGSLNGSALNNGTYVYFFKALDSNGDKISSKGTVSLIK